MTDAKRPRSLGKPITRAEAREIQKARSQRAKTLDSKKTSKVTSNKERWAQNPGKFDYPNIDTAGQGANAGEGYSWKGKKKKSKQP